MAACRWCPATTTEVVVGPFGPHYGKEVCPECGRQQRWIAWPIPPCPVCRETAPVEKSKAFGKWDLYLCRDCGAEFKR